MKKKKKDQKGEDYSSNEIILKLAEEIAEERGEQKEKLKEHNSLEDKIFQILHGSNKGDDDLQTLFHRLNYQRVVDKMDTQLNQWKWGVFGFAIVSAVLLFGYTNFFEPVISKDHGIDEYHEMLKAVNHEINYHPEYKTIYTDPKDSTKIKRIVNTIRNKNPDMTVLESVTETYFNTYFLRFILIRLVLITILITLVTAGIKVYMRMRKDRMVLTIKEEGTTTTLYLFKKFLSVKKEQDQEYSEAGQKLIAEMLPAIVSELYHLPSSNDVKKDKFSLTHRMMGILEKMATNQRTKDK